MMKEIMTERTMALVNSHSEKYPESRITDVYKLIYQACMGPEHAITNCANTNTWLMQEWDSLEGDPDEVLYEELSLHYPLFRLNLRPAKAKKVEPSKISDSFFALSNEFPKKPEVLISVWEIITEKIKNGSLILPDSDEIKEFNDFITARQFPAMHHSDEYAKAYRPAYRLVGSEI
jgi:hypothetical protein